MSKINNCQTAPIYTLHL